MSVRVLFCLVPYPFAVSCSMFSGVEMVILLFFSVAVMVFGSLLVGVWEVFLGCFKSGDLDLLRYVACLKFKLC